MNEILHLQLPHMPDKVLEYLYGDWAVKNTKIAGKNTDCAYYAEEEETIAMTSAVITSTILSQELFKEILSQEQVGKV